MYIKMQKIDENHNFVFYKFETSVLTGNTVLDARGRILNEVAKKSGVFKFNKIDDKKEDSIVMIEDQTDPILLANKNIKFACLYKMNKCKSKKFFDDIVEYASG